MEVTFEYKYFIFIFFEFASGGRTTLTQYGKGTLNELNLKVSNAQQDIALHWPKGIVTYHIDTRSYDQFIAQRVRTAMNVLESVTCVKFSPTPQKPSGNITWIHFTNPQGERNCVHEPKLRNSGEIVLVLGFDCLKEHEVLHTVLHGIGFKDEVSHPLRDQYIRVMWNNIRPDLSASLPSLLVSDKLRRERYLNRWDSNKTLEYRHLYRVRSSDEMSSSLLVEYDPLSIMHFHDRAFSMNGHATLMPLVPGLVISSSNDLSQLDKMRLRLLFDHECNKRKVGDMIESCKKLLINDDKASINSNANNMIDSASKDKDSKNRVNTGKVSNEKEKDVEEEKVKVKENEKPGKDAILKVENQYDLNESNPDNESEVDKAGINVLQDKQSVAESVSGDAENSEVDYQD